MFSKVANKGAFWSLIATRIVYAINWFNIASVYSEMAVGFGVGVSGLGFLTSSFGLGIGIFQIPAGILAVKSGPRIVAVFGTALASGCVLLSGLATWFPEVVLLRFLVGAGMAFVFAPGVILIAQYYRRGAEGLGIGLYNSAYDVGGALGLFLWAVLAVTVGWRPSLIGSGALGLFTALLLFVLVPKERVGNTFSIRAVHLKRILLDGRLFLMGLTALGIGIGTTLIGSFVVYYLVRALGLAPPIAGAIGSSVLIVPILSSPLGGRIYDKRKNFKKLLLLSGTLLSIALIIAGFGGIYGAVLSTLLGGFAAGVAITVSFSAARELYRVVPEYESLSVAWVNCISLTGSFWPPILFSFFASSFGYTAAWVEGGISALVFVLAILFVKNPLPRPTASTRDS